MQLLADLHIFVSDNTPVEDLSRVEQLLTILTEKCEDIGKLTLPMYTICYQKIIHFSEFLYA